MVCFGVGVGGDVVGGVGLGFVVRGGCGVGVDGWGFGGLWCGWGVCWVGGVV